MGSLTLIAWASAGVLLVGGYLGVTHLWDSLDEARLELSQARLALQSEQNLREANEGALTNLMKARSRAATVTKELSHALPTLVPHGTVLPPGWRLHHDAAAAGVSLSASGPAAAPVDAQVAAATVADNYAACREQDATYQELQQWLMKIRPSPQRPSQ